MKCFVTGGSGFIGANLVHEIVSRGNEVKVLLRPDSDLRGLQRAEYERVIGDVADRAQLTTAMRGCNWCFHVAASYHLWLRDYTPMYVANVEGTRNVIEAAIEAGAIALDNAIRLQRAEELSVTDDLTSLYNARYLAQVLRREVKRALRSNRPLSLLFIDLDGFKMINDTHGHLFGSRALIEAADVIRGSARETDVGARYGGDEFALVLADTGSEGAVALGERVRERIASHGFLSADGLNIHLTASVGVATMPDVASSVESLIQLADKAMYWVKDHGKNGIHVAGLGE